VLTVPGEITSPLSAGTNALLKLGATPCTSAADVLELFGLTSAAARRPQVAGDAAHVLAALPGTPDELTRATGLDARTIAVALAELELAGAAFEGDGTFRPAAPPS